MVPYDRFRPLAAAAQLRVAAACRITEEAAAAAAAAAALDQPCRNWRSTKLRFRFLQLDSQEIFLCGFLFCFLREKKNNVAGCSIYLVFIYILNNKNQVSICPLNRNIISFSFRYIIYNQTFGSFFLICCHCKVTVASICTTIIPNLLYR